MATGFREFGNCAVFTDHDRSTCAEVTSPDSPMDFVLKANMSQSETSAHVIVTMRDCDCNDNTQVVI